MAYKTDNLLRSFHCRGQRVSNNVISSALKRVQFW